MTSIIVFTLLLSTVQFMIMQGGFLCILALILARTIFLSRYFIGKVSKLGNAFEYIVIGLPLILHFIFGGIESWWNYILQVIISLVVIIIEAYDRNNFVYVEEDVTDE